MKNKKLYITLFALSIIFLGIGGTFAYLTTSVTATNITQVKSGNLTMTVDGGGNENVTLFPAKCTSAYAIKKTIKASAKNTSGGKVSFSIGMNVATLSSDLKRATMKYALSTSATSCTDGLVANGNFKDATVGSDIWLVKNDYDNITNTSNTYNKTYYLYIWLDETETQNLSGSISVNMKGTSSNNPNLTTEAVKTIPLYDYIKNSADTTTTIDFSKTSASSGTNGIYTTTDTDSGEPVYYYRGAVDNNVLFANFCWKIIRTTETGGVKLIYNGVPANGQCNNTTGDATTIGSSAFNSTDNDAKYVGYMYGDSIDDTTYTDDSKIKGVIDDWYKTNMTSYTLQLEDTVFCNDRSYTTSGSALYFGAYTRLTTNKTPTLKCQNTKDKFTVDASNGNGALTYPVGLITADEIAYAGGVNRTINSSFYLYNNEIQWTFSPSDISGPYAYEFNLSDSGNLLVSVVSGGGRVARPVVSLKPGITVTGGPGTAESPFVIS